MTQVDLNAKFPSMTPIKKAPPLFLLNGCGLGMYGRRDFDKETQTYIATWCFALLIPIFALRAYRVAKAEQGWYFIGREPLSPFARRSNSNRSGGAANGSASKNEPPMPSAII